MLDIRFIRENAELIAEKSRQKGYEVDVQKLLHLDDEKRQLISQIESLRAARNEHAQMLATRGGPGPGSRENIVKGKSFKEQITQLETQFKPIDEELEGLQKSVPNVFPDDTPHGGEEASREEKKWGDTSDKGFEVIDHAAWAESQERQLLDFSRGAKVAGNKFYYTKGPLVELELALLQAGLALATKNGFVPMMVPHLVNTQVLEGAGFSAKGEERQIYKIEGEDLNLIATAEIPLTGFHADEQMVKLPRLYVGFSPSYRLEAGAYGKHSKGLYRVHQFNKLELYVFCEGNLEESERWHQQMVALEEEFCELLEIPYRRVRIAAGDLGAPAYKKYDIEYWSPVDKTYRELMSCSNVTDYQARRLSVRYKDAAGQTHYVHTLNGTLAAMSRLTIAIIENFQTKDGNVLIPTALKPYMQSRETL